MFKKTTLATAILVASAATGAFAADMTDDSMYAAAESSGNAFFDDASITGGVYTFSRKRNRYNPESAKFETNLDHTSVLGNVDFSSGYIGGIVGLDLGIYGSMDLQQGGGVDHEMNFFPWDNPYKPDWSQAEAKDDVSFYKAALKLKLANTWAKAGYIQPSGPGGLGVNWNFLPGTYRGAQFGADFGNLSVAYMWADEYKAPWFQETYGFRTRNPDAGLTGANDIEIDYLHSVGAVYTFNNGLILDGAFSQSDDYLDTYHAKLKHSMEIADGTLNLAYHFYGAKDAGDLAVYDGNAWQQALTASFAIGPYTLKAESTITRAKGKQGYFVYRTTVPSGTSAGAYDLWWDSRSDFNHDGEKAVYAGLWRDLADMDLAGWRVGASFAYGWDGKPSSDANVQDAELKESAVNVDIGYTVQDGNWKGSSLALHWTNYDNHSGQPSWTNFKNAFQDEHDIKLTMVIPYSF